MNRLILLIILILPLVCFSQTQKEVTRYYENKKIHEKYTVLPGDSLKDGAYTRWHKNGNLWAVGTFARDERHGIWEFYETESLPFDCLYRYDYSNDRMIYRQNPGFQPDFIGGPPEYEYVWNQFMTDNQAELKKLIGDDLVQVYIRMLPTGLPDSIVFVPDTIQFSLTSKTLLRIPPGMSEEKPIDRFYHVNSETISLLKRKIMEMPVWYETEAKTDECLWLIMDIEY